MESKDSYLSGPETKSPKVSEGTSVKGPVIPLVSPEEAERVFSSQRLMSLEESWEQVDRSLGRLKDFGGAVRFRSMRSVRGRIATDYG